MEKLRESFREVLTSVVPMCVLILILGFVFAPFDAEMMIAFLGGAVMMIIGMALFLFGADISMMEVGSRVGAFLVRKRSLLMLLGIGGLIGFVITVAEPDVMVLAGHVNDVSDGRITGALLICFVGVGVGVYIAVALARIVFQISLYKVLLVGYALIFLLASFTSPSFMPVAFDSGGVTTGPMTVPFILALGTGITSTIRTSKDGNDSFGMVGLASLGPVMSVLILGVIFR